MRDFSQDTTALALNTATLGHNVDGHGAGWSPEQVIDACAERGFGGIVWWRRELAGRAVEIGERTRAAGLKVGGLCRAPFLVGPMAPPSEAEMFDDFRHAIDQAQALGAPVLTIVVGGVVTGTVGVQESLKQVTGIVGKAVEHARAAGVTLALEPLHPMYAGNRSCLVTTRDAVDMCEAIGAPELAVAIDVYHLWWDTSLAGQLARLRPEQIAGFHLCDWLPGTSDILLDRGMMGDGVADLKALRAIVENAGYDGLCEVEVFSANNWWKRPPAEVLDTCVSRFKTVC
jgi:sugar phosphate isomerase/epimerase